MASQSITKFVGGFIIGAASLSVLTLSTIQAIKDSHDPNPAIITGNQYFLTSENPDPEIYVDTTPLVQFQSGSTNIRLKNGAKIVGSGAQVNLFGSLTLSEVNAYSSGSLSIPNPFPDPLLCGAPILDVVTAASPSARVDVYAGTGAIGTMGLNITGSTVLQNNLVLGAGVYTLSGSALFDSGSRPKVFKLYPTTSTTQVNTINITADTQSGSGLVGTYTIPCTIDG